MMQMNYEKDNLERAPRSPQKTPLTIKKSKAFAQIEEAGENYRKEEGTRLPYSFYIIVSGGERREKDYFRLISNQDYFQRIKVEFIADPQQLNPQGLLNIAKKKQKQYKQSANSQNPDRIFLISDVDHFYPELLTIQEEATRNRFTIVISNPCFEVWLYYGKCKEKPTDFKKTKEAKKISQAFKQHLDQKIAGGVNPKKAILDIRSAIENAKLNFAKDSRGIPELFSTNMFELAEEILPLIDKELEQYASQYKDARKAHLD